MNEESESSPDLIGLTVEVVSAFVANNALKSGDLAGLIRDTHAALAGLGDKPASDAPAEPEFTPAISVRKSLGKPEVIISMIDGKPYRALKRHLAARGLTPQQYRARYNLPADYPMVAPAYSEARRQVAKRLGLGRKPKAPQAAAPVKAPPRRRGRPPKGA